MQAALDGFNRGEEKYGVKWGLMPKDESMNIRYLLCNADEMEPNTYKDRMLMAGMRNNNTQGAS